MHGMEHNDTKSKRINDGGILRNKSKPESSRQSVTFREEQPFADNQQSHNMNPEDVKRVIAARIIERAWLSYRDRKMYKLLKHATCAAETSLSYEILRKISPKEANLLRDKGMPVKVRFRFGGEEFPPMVYFKIFSDTSITRVKYMSGKKAITPASKAAEEACDLMGKRKFLQIMVQDNMCQARYKVTDEMDVTTLKDYMQYLSHIDELPGYMGGKDNFWRKLTLDVIPRQTIFYDIMDFLHHKNLTKRLQEEMPLLAKSPVNADIEFRHIETISRMSTPPATQHSPTKVSIPLKSGRRSKQAKQRVEQMRKMYGLLTDTMIIQVTLVAILLDLHLDSVCKLQAVERQEEVSDEEGLGEEADKLFQWTQELSFDELDRMTGSRTLLT
ncbi:uncharacterized protein CXorf58-like [Watersipora subatra]|uniref:uncharacterized protein CXorf58-like n=1 Tax=Watersipora subatra TaxID=2589382 RepID=UPI00355B3B99